MAGFPSMATLKNARKAGESFGAWIYGRLGLQSLTYHVPAYANRLPYLLGGITLFGTVILIVTGVYLAQFYHPDPADAHASVFYITTEAELGDFVRSVHYWTAHVVMVTLLLHLLRVFIWGAYRAPREATWALGVGLLAVMMGFFFTGTVIKWDQEGFEALSHNEEIGKLLGSMGAWFTTEFSRSAPLLERVYTAHVTILPALLTLLVIGHVYLIRFHGIAPRPADEPAQLSEDIHAAAEGRHAEGISHFNIHIRKIAGYGLLLAAFAGILSLTLGAPLGQMPVPGEELTKPPWMFIWLYPFEDWFGVDSLLWIPMVVGVALLLVPLLDRFRTNSRRRALMLLGLVIIVLAALLAFGLYGWESTPAKHIMD